MRALAFAPQTGDVRVRAARFEERSSLPVSAACVVASNVRETLAPLLRAPVRIRLFEPAIPSPLAWAAIASGAILYRVRGGLADAAIVVRPDDALVLAATAFGERVAPTGVRRALSPFELDVLGRIADAIAASLGAVCGPREGRAVERVGAIDGFVTYFELLLEEPAEVRIGIALSRDPAPEPHGRLQIDDLAGVDLPARAVLDVGEVAARALAALTPGALLPIARVPRAALSIGGRTYASGSCGVSDGCYALTIGEV